MKYLLLIYLTLIIGCSSAQKTNPKEISVDSLKKYSYYIGFEVLKLQSAGLVIIFDGNGTGFFIRQSDSLYLITARHNVVPCENGEKLFLKTLFVWLQDKNGKPTEKISIEPFQFLDLKCRQQKNDTDAIAIKLNIKLPVYSIESFVLSIPTEYEEVEIWGYPENKKDTSKMADFELISSTILPVNSYSFETVHDTITNTTDLVNSYLVSKTAINNNSRSGYSGSPVFMKDKNTKRWIFIGLNWGHGDFGGVDKYLKLVRPDLVLDKIESLKSKQ